jgi:hypothetical protein
MSIEESGRPVPESSWFKSSYRTGSGGECIEMAVAWHKSSHSSGDGGQCIEVAACPGTVYVRDSKDKAGPISSFDPAARTGFVEFAAGGFRH